MFFLFKQKTAYEMRISDWSSDVCSSDLWTNRCRTLEGFDATAHQLHNVIATINGDRATVTSIVDAVHVVRAGDRALLGDLIGRYTHRLVYRKGVGEGKRVSVRVDLGGRRCITKKIKKTSIHIDMH